MTNVDQLRCPRCGSSQVHAGNRGWKWTTGFIGSGKVALTCLNCGKKGRPGDFTPTLTSAPLAEGEGSGCVAVVAGTLVTAVLYATDNWVWAAVIGALVIGYVVFEARRWWKEPLPKNSKTKPDHGVDLMTPVSSEHEGTSLIENEAARHPRNDELQRAAASSDSSGSAATFRFCNHCGKRLPADVNFCGYCGQQILRADQSGRD